MSASEPLYVAPRIGHNKHQWSIGQPSQTLSRVASSNLSFEVIVVTGPTMDGTHELVAAWAEAHAVKVAHCPNENLSQARNIGIRHAIGSLIAFIDDDAIPQPEWLKQLVAVFDLPDVGGAGGVVFDL
jgi:glycosyltransferase involved in cell wall biosynthesis